MLVRWSLIPRASCFFHVLAAIVFAAQSKMAPSSYVPPSNFGAGMLNPLIASLPEPLVLPLDPLPELSPTLQLLFSEAFSESPGRQAAIDRLFEYVFVLLIRSAMNRHLIDSGILR